MDILFVNKFFWRKGGSETVFFDEMAMLEAHGHRVIPFAMHDERNLDSPYARYFVEHIDYEGGLRQKLIGAGRVLYSFDARRQMTRLLADHPVDVAHFHIFQHQISPSVFAPLRKAGVPLILTLHDLKPMCPNYRMYTQGRICEACMGRRFYNCVRYRCTKNSRFKSLINTVEMYFHYAMRYYQKVDRFIAVSRFYREKMIEFGFPPEQVVHIPNFIDTQRFRHVDRDQGYGLYLGRLSWGKGLETLIDACAKTPQIPMVIAGTGSLEDDLKAEVARRGLDNVRFVGYQTGNALQRLIEDASFSVIPSQAYENCPMSVLESLAVGTPVIGSRLGGIPELIEDGEDGLHFTPGDAEDLAQKMLFLWSSDTLRKEMGYAGAQRIAREHAPERHYQRLTGLYEAVLSGAA